MIAVILRCELLRASKDDLVGLFGASFETPRFIAPFATASLPLGLLGCARLLRMTAVIR